MVHIAQNPNQNEATAEAAGTGDAIGNTVTGSAVGPIGALAATTGAIAEILRGQKIGTGLHDHYAMKARQEGLIA